MSLFTVVPNHSVPIVYYVLVMQVFRILWNVAIESASSTSSGCFFQISTTLPVDNPILLNRSESLPSFIAHPKMDHRDCDEWLSGAAEDLVKVLWYWGAGRGWERELLNIIPQSPDGGQHKGGHADVLMCLTSWDVQLPVCYWPASLKLAVKCTLSFSPCFSTCGEYSFALLTCA